ncbi:tudor domain-containing protein 7 isoform X2 [Pseudomyrmex gracilis]|nr:tudor domain-containing protein 7 isoform X2 [Pseudomyrmex gracilis]XP_020295931.1 tudor domain-containing protein 7 isoform X2 [Pseudomyrmex gracilis]XP_020295932.1 tudor domain-containing protein 7 isoform X2 [Pseudomyrmex gracilis]
MTMDKSEVIKNLRSCLISCKGGIKLTNLRDDYLTVVGEALPFRQFGYSSVEDFVRNISEVLVTNKNGELYVEAKPSDTTAHLTKLIARQKSRKVKRPKKVNKGFFPRRTNFNSSQRIRAKSNYADSSSSFIRSASNKSNSHTNYSSTDLFRPPPLMQTIMHPLPNYNKPSFSSGTPPVASISTKRLNDKMTNLNITTANQSINHNQNNENLKPKVLIDKSATVIPVQSKKTAEQKPSKLSERLKITLPNSSSSPVTLSPSIDNYSNNTSSIYIPPTSNVLKTISKSKPLDPRQELESYARELNLSTPVYWISSNKEKHSAKITVYAGVRVGTQTFSTYPEPAESEEEAKKSAARIALTSFSKESLNLRVTTTVDMKLVKERILQIVNQHTAGVFMHQLPVYYNKQYGEALPEDWQTIVKESAEINKEKGAGDWTILCQCSSTSKFSESNSMSSHNAPDHSISFPSDEKIHLKPIGPVVPGQLTLPHDAIWEVYTACVINTTEVWVRFGDDNEKFVNMMNNMRKYYNKVKEGVSECVVGDFYALLEDDSWHRVQCINFDSETEMAEVRFIDVGYEEVYKSNLLYPLEKEFCALPIQAMRVSLHELEEFCDCAQVVAEVENYLLVEQMFVVKVHSMDFDNSYATVTFYDTSDDTVDININELIFDKLLNDIDVASKIHPGKLIELYVTHLYEDGKIFAQLNTLAKILLDEAISQISKSDAFVKTISFTKTYLVKWCQKWHRVRVIDIPNNDDVKIFFIDHGQVIITSKQCLLNRSSKALERIPPQAVQIFLHNVDTESHRGQFVERFRELVLDEDLLLAKVVKVSATGVPIVEIFKRIGPSNMLASINTSLTLGNELSKVNDDLVNNNVKVKKRLERKVSRVLESVGNLQPPTISDIRKYFDVHVILVAHPGHFIVQPLNDASHLEAMIINLQKSCNSYNGPPAESVGKGKLYAGKFKDQWRRVYVTNIISDNEVSVYFCDFGDVTILPRDSLQPLKSEFLKLPYQAIKAKLVGIEPINSDWSVEDSLRFKDLVLNKNFVSVVVESSSDHYSPANGVVLGLQLIDVNTPEDIYIDRLLVEEKRAKYTEGYPSAYPHPYN